MVDPKLIETRLAKMFSIASELTKLTGRPFTLDGHLLGSSGEIFAKIHYGVELYSPSHPDHDGILNGRKVQIRSTQKELVDLKGPTDLLLVLQIRADGTFTEIYNGDGKRPWKSLSRKRATKAGKKSISLQRLRKLSEQVKPENKILRKRSAVLLKRRK